MFQHFDRCYRMLKYLFIKVIYLGSAKRPVAHTDVLTIIVEQLPNKIIKFLFFTPFPIPFFPGKIETCQIVGSIFDGLSKGI